MPITSQGTADSLRRAVLGGSSDHQRPALSVEWQGGFVTEGVGHGFRIRLRDLIGVGVEHPSGYVRPHHQPVLAGAGHSRRNAQRRARIQLVERDRSLGGQQFRQRPCDGTIVERAGRAFRQGVPNHRGVRADQGIGIEGRRAGHRQYLTASGIEGHHRAPPFAQGSGGGCLELVVQGQLDRTGSQVITEQGVQNPRGGQVAARPEK